MWYSFSEEEVAERDREMEELRENATYSMVRAAREIRALSHLTPEEHVAIERLLAVFDPPPAVKEEPDISF